MKALGNRPLLISNLSAVGNEEFGTTGKILEKNTKNRKTYTTIGQLDYHFGDSKTCFD